MDALTNSIYRQFDEEHTRITCNILKALLFQQIIKFWSSCFFVQQKMMDIAETDQTKQTLQHLKSCVDFQNKLWKETPNPSSCSAQNFVTRSNNFIDFHDFLVLMVDNRIQVTKDQNQIRELKIIFNLIEANVNYIKDCCLRIRQNHNLIYLLHQNVTIHFYSSILI